MNTLQSLTSMIFTWTTLIELILILSPCLIYPYWLAFLILLCYLSFLVRKTYQYLQLIKLSNQMAISNEDIPKEMKAAFYSSNIHFFFTTNPINFISFKEFCNLNCHISAASCCSNY